MNGPAMVAAHLDDRTDAVLESWRLAVHESGEVPRSRSLTRAEFLDHIPLLMDRMIERLQGRSSNLSLVAEKHGQERWNQGYDIVELIAEHNLLRSILVRSTFSFAREHDFDLAALESSQAAIHDVLDEAQSESVRQFQEESERRNRSASAEVENQGRAVDEARLAAEIERSRIRALLENLPVGVWVADAAGQIATLNREAEILRDPLPGGPLGSVGSGTPDPLGRSYRPDGTGYDPGEVPIARALRGEKVEQEEMLWSKGAGMRVVSASASPLRDARDAIIGAVMVVQDVTARKRLESDLVAASAQLTGIIERSPVMIWRTGPDGRNDFVNRTFLDFLGVDVNFAMSERWIECVHPDHVEAVTENFSRALASRSDFALDYRVRDRSGDYRWIASHGVPFVGEAGEFLGYLGTWLDITDRHQLEAALQHQKRIAEESSMHKTRLMSALSHDARTPLNAVVLSAQLLEMHVQDGDNPEVEECLRTIRNGVKNVLDLLGDLLDLTRIDAGAMPVDSSRFALEESIAECVSSIQTPARMKGLDFRVELDGIAAMLIEADRAKIKQILANFLSNALRYTEKGSIRLSACRTATEIRIAVQDSGIGIAEADQDRVFDEFATLENPRRAVGEGTGLGLAICRRIAGLLGGNIELRSEPGRGSTFTLVLPSSLIVEGTPDATRPDPALEIVPEGAILVAEDHPDSRRTLSRLLRRMGYRVMEAADGNETLELCRAERPHAILMDVNMPGMNGIDATLAIRGDPSLREVPIFALTGDVTAENQRRIGEAGVQGYLEKPVTNEALRQALASVGRT